MLVHVENNMWYSCGVYQFGACVYHYYKNSETAHVHYLQDSGCQVQGVNFYGTPWSVRCGRDWAFQALDNDEEGYGLAEKYAAVPLGIDVLVTHQPPLGMQDMGDTTRQGSTMLAARVRDVKPLVHVFGHIHTGHGATKGGYGDGPETLFVNAAICDEDYQPVQKPILVQMVHADGAQ